MEGERYPTDNLNCINITNETRYDKGKFNLIRVSFCLFMEQFNFK